MIKYSGNPVYNGIAVGPAFVLRREDRGAERVRIENPEDEAERFRQAVKQCREELRKIYDMAVMEVGEDGAAIFESHQIILQDENYLEAVYRLIREENVNAEYAVAAVGGSFSDMFEGMEDEYMRARAADVRDVTGRLLRRLGGGGEVSLALSQPSVVVADDLSPSETVRMDKEKILAFVTVRGSVNSHTAILARTMNIPALVGTPLDLNRIRTGMKTVVDGFSGEVIFEPEASLCREAERRAEREREERRLLEGLKGKETVTLSGKRVKLCANIGSVGDVGRALENDADGIGLFRSEFLYLERSGPPTEEEQLHAYRQVLEAMGEKRVIIRTMDIGADKQADYLRLEKEENPALGCRAIRICLRRPDIFKTQLRALFRAAVVGNLSVMYPMVISTGEVERILEMAGEVERELAEAGLPYRVPEQGIMIETPAAVMISDRLAKMVDFFSIGTNDLTQYTLAVDRQSGGLEDLYNPRHEAIVRMIRMVADNAHRCGKWVGICGELGGDLELTESFVEMGIDELSVAPALILPLRRRIREIP